MQNATNLLKINYAYNTPNVADNNGNVKSQTITVPTVGANQGFVATQNYEYDSLNRLKSATETIGGAQSWKQSFVYDRFGNRNFDTNNTTTLGSCQTAVCNPAVDISKNRFTTAQGYQYDLSGNVINDAEGRTFTYDAENKQKEVRDVSNNVVGQYFYDGDGRRVKKVSSTETVIFVYNTEGELIAEYANQPPQNPQVSYLTTDALGSPRIKTDANGNVISRNDYLPFGEDLYTAQRTLGLNYTTDNIRRKFTTYKRDDETGLDFAEARYYSSRWGRFVSPDEFTGGPDELFDFEENASNNPTFYSDLENPQSLNKYQYTYNNPLNMTDADGHEPEDISGGGGALYCPWCGILRFPISRPIVQPRPITMPRPVGPIPPVPIVIDPELEKMVPPVELPATKLPPIPETQPSQVERRKTPYVPPKPRNIGVRHPSRKRAKEAAEHPRPGKKMPQPKKDAPKKKRERYEEQQKYKRPERNKNPKHPDSHFHNLDKSRKPVNPHHYYPKRF